MRGPKNGRILPSKNSENRNEPSGLLGIPRCRIATALSYSSSVREPSLMVAAIPIDMIWLAVIVMMIMAGFLAATAE